MPAQNKTTLLRLNQWLENEYPKMIDFNEDNLAIENAIKEIKDSLSNLNYVDSVTLSGSEIVIVKKGATTRIPLPKGFSGSWNDLTNKPDIEVADWGKIKNKPINFPTTWDNIQGKPNNLATNESVATAKSDLESKISKKVDLVQVLSSKDLNTIFSVGLYSCTSCTNRPSSASSYGSLLVLKADGNSNITATTDTIQIYIDSNSKIFVRDSVDKTNSWDTWKEQVNTDLTGQLNNLRTTNKGNLVSAINEVFQLGVDRGGIIKNKIGALAGKTMQNMGDVADELEKYDIEYILESLFSLEDDLTDYEIFGNYFVYVTDEGTFAINMHNLNEKSIKFSEFTRGDINYNNQLVFQKGYSSVNVYDLNSKKYKNYEIYGSKIAVYKYKDKIYIISLTSRNALNIKNGVLHSLQKDIFTEIGDLCGNSKYICMVRGTGLKNYDTIYVYNVLDFKLLKTIQLEDDIRDMVLFENSDKLFCKTRGLYSYIIDIKSGNKIKSYYNKGFFPTTSGRAVEQSHLIRPFCGIEKIFFKNDKFNIRKLNYYEYKFLNENLEEIIAFDDSRRFNSYYNDYFVYLEFDAADNERAVYKLIKTLKKVR